MLLSSKLSLTRHEKFLTIATLLTGHLASILDVTFIWSSASLSTMLLSNDTQISTFKVLAISTTSKEYALAFFFLIFFLRTIIRIARIQTEVRLRAVLSDRLTTTIFEKQIDRHHLDKTKRDSAEMLRDIDSIQSLLNRFVFSRFVIFEECLLVLGIALAIAINSTIWGVGIMMFGGLLLYLISRTTSKKLSQFGHDNAISQAQKMQFAIFAYRAIRELIAYDKTRSAVKFFRTKLKSTLEAEKKFHVISQNSSLAIEVIIVASVTLALWISLTLQADRSQIISNAAIVALSSFRIIPSLSRLNAAFQQRRFTQHQTDLLLSYLENSPASNLAGSAAPIQPPHLNSSELIMKKSTNVIVEFENVTFAYSLDKPAVIQNLSHVFEKGKLHIIRGKSGTGKSTILNLIIGFYEPQVGRILVNQVPLRNSRILCDHKIAYMPQSSIALNYSLSDNISLAFGDDEEVDKSRLEFAISAAGLIEFVESLPDGVKTLIGDFGAGISGGQLQRISLARALYRQSQVLLLDEATSNLDSETEDRILRDLVSLKEQKLIIVVSHSDRVAQFADKILEL